MEKRLKEIRRVLDGERMLIAVSGGVDSTVCAVLTHRAIGENLLCVLLDDAFMREGEPERVAEVLSKPPLSLPVKVLNVRERFLDALKGLRDAEDKRKAFRETFYEVLGETAESEKCRFLVQGTIYADILVPYVALAEGKSVYLTRAMTAHLETNIWLTQEILGTKFQVTKKGNLFCIEKS